MQTKTAQQTGRQAGRQERGVVTSIMNDAFCCTLPCSDWYVVLALACVVANDGTEVTAAWLRA
jgi:hypothetical protein